MSSGARARSLAAGVATMAVAMIGAVLVSSAAAQDGAPAPIVRVCLDGKGSYHAPGEGPCKSRVTRTLRGTVSFIDPGFRVDVGAPACRTNPDGSTVPQRVVVAGLSGFEWFDEEVGEGRVWTLCDPAAVDVIGDPVHLTADLTAFSALRLFGYGDAATRFTKRWSVNIDGVEIASGQLRVKVRRLQSEGYATIYDTDFDRYVNVCINGGHRIYARGGHLYCTVLVRAGLTRVTARLLGTPR
ncbi:MAG: hypothetical protein AB7O78_01620 [Thermoleophilia bacterium]